MTGAAIGILLYRGAVVDAPTDRQTDSKRPTRVTIPFLSAEIHEHERTSLNCSRARARTHARTNAPIAVAGSSLAISI